MNSIDINISVNFDKASDLVEFVNSFGPKPSEGVIESVKRFSRECDTAKMDWMRLIRDIDLAAKSEKTDGGWKEGDGVCFLLDNRIRFGVVRQKDKLCSGVYRYYVEYDNGIGSIYLVEHCMFHTVEDLLDSLRNGVS